MKLIFILILFFTVNGYTKELTKVRSAYDSKNTVQKISELLNKKKITIFSTIDHQAGAKKADLALKPTTLITFGNPKLGTIFMQENQLAGYNLPMKVLVYTDKKDRTFIAYQKIKAFMKENHLKKNKEISKKISKLFSEFRSAVSI